MRFYNVNFGDGVYYAGEARDTYQGYEPDGIGVMKFSYDNKLIMCSRFSYEAINGLGFEYYTDQRYGSFSKFNYGKFYGPTLSFGYEKYLIYENYDYNEHPRNFSVHVFYNGNYIIYEESNSSVRNAVGYYDGYLYFLKLDQNKKIISSKEIKYVGTDYAFTSKRMFCMQMDENKPIHNESGHTKSGLVYELGTQLLTPYSVNYFGYGAVKWSDGSYYFGEWVDNNREGMGIYVDDDGTTYMGKFYKNKRYGNGLVMYNNGVIRMGNWTEGKREGISFEIGDDYVVIINYKNDEVYGNKFQVFKGAEQVSEFNKSGNVGRYYY